ncbi:MAG TPA: type II toxin-antitoxin system RelE/ParE family toxin [Thermoanaerobaculia bacterium]|jgi:plasmid stabilization system protein ParE|nr:type II toxin-antitoxin system RelE/ParE family toxin [Thermoanaerobaculia bacterium]
MMQFRFHPEADEELFEAQAWYEKRSEAAAQAFAMESDHALSRIADAPLRYPQGWRGEHRFLLDRFPYTLLYRVRGDHIYITAVAHQSRRPGYWRHRK